VFPEQVNDTMILDNLKRLVHEYDVFWDESDRMRYELAQHEWQPGCKRPLQPGRYQVASRRDKYEGMNVERGQGEWFYEHRDWNGHRWLVNEGDMVVLWWRMVVPTPDDTDRDHE
jgi:hypothetical protein